MFFNYGRKGNFLLIFTSTRTFLESFESLFRNISTVDQIVQELVRSFYYEGLNGEEEAVNFVEEADVWDGLKVDENGMKDDDVFRISQLRLKKKKGLKDTLKNIFLKKEDHGNLCCCVFTDPGLK